MHKKQTARRADGSRFAPNRFHVDGDLAIIELTDPWGRLIGNVLIDTADLERVINAGRWHLDDDSVTVRTKSTPRIVQMSRFIMQPPAGRNVRRINGDKLDNRRKNLYIAI